MNSYFQLELYNFMPLCMVIEVVQQNHELLD